MKKIIIAEHYGFCMGVKRAISLTEETVARTENVTILKEIVHNEAVVEKFRSEGVGQSSSIHDISGGTVIIPAHGASPEIFKSAAVRGIKVIDATCPLVIRIHKIVRKLAEEGYQILHYGDSEHDETIAIVDHAPNRVIVIANPTAIDRMKPIRGEIALTSQTTAEADVFVDVEKKARGIFPQIRVYNTICNATGQRQAAIRNLAPKVDLVLVVGSASSANSKRLVQISKALHKPAFLVNSMEEIRPEWLDDEDSKIETVGLSAGASTPDFLIEGAIERLKEIANGSVEVIYPKKKSIKNKLALNNP